MMSKEKLTSFNKRFDVVGCFIEYNGNFLLLRRNPDKANGGTWGLPAGKKEEGEDIQQAVIREIQEETGIQLEQSDVHYSSSLYVRDGDFDIMWHTFSIKLSTESKVILNPHEHSEFQWVLPSEALQMNLIHDLPELVEMFYPN